MSCQTTNNNWIWNFQESIEWSHQNDWLDVLGAILGGVLGEDGEGKTIWKDLGGPRRYKEGVEGMSSVWAKQHLKTQNIKA